MMLLIARAALRRRPSCRFHDAAAGAAGVAQPERKVPRKAPCSALLQKYSM